MAEWIKAGAMIFAAFIALYLIVVLVVWAGQERFIYQVSSLPAGYRFTFEASFEEIRIPTADGETINALFFQAEGKKRGAVLYFHGNRGDLSRWGHMHHPFTERGYDVLMIDYRGYGKSTGKPSEAGLYKDGEAALQWLLQHHRIEQVVFYGRSLGSGLAACLATRYTPKALLMETPYDALPNVIQHQVMLPLPKGIFRHQFPSHRYLSAVKCPTYILAGNRDRLIPLYLAKRLQPLLSSPSHFFVIQGAGHHNLAAFQAYHLAMDRLLLP